MARDILTVVFLVIKPILIDGNGAHIGISAGSELLDKCLTSFVLLEVAGKTQCLAQLFERTGEVQVVA